MLLFCYHCHAFVIAIWIETSGGAEVLRYPQFIRIIGEKNYQQIEQPHKNQYLPDKAQDSRQTDINIVDNPSQQSR